MELLQNVRHWAAKQALRRPVVGDVAQGTLVDLHNRIFLGKADEARRGDAPATPAKLEEPAYENAIAGSTTMSPSRPRVVGGTWEPADVDPSEAPGVDEDVSAG
jgi:hypothetical protein